MDEKQMTPWDAFEESRKADIHEVLFTLFCLLPAPLMVAYLAIRVAMDHLT